MTEAIQLEDLPQKAREGSSSKPFTPKESTRQDEIKSVEIGLGPVTNALQQWNNPRINIWRFFASVMGFIVMGMNDAAYGVC